MSVFFAILIIVILLWPLISKWLRGFMARRAEDMLRRMAGAPTRKQEQKARRKREKEQRAQKPPTPPGPKPTDLMREVAEDVEFTEIKDFSSTTIETENGRYEQRTYRESQVEDVKFTEVKEKR